MKALFVSNDPTIFDATSSARARMRTYAAAIGELHIVSAAGLGVREEQDGNLCLYPVHAWKLFRVHALARKAREIIIANDIQIVSAQDPFEHGLARTSGSTRHECKTAYPSTYRFPFSVVREKR